MKDGESSSKARQGRKIKETEHQISRCQIFAHLISRCENFAHPKARCENFAHHYSRCENFLPFSHTKFQGAKWADQGAKSSHGHPTHQCEISGSSNSHLSPFHHGENQRRPFRFPILTETSTTMSRHGSHTFTSCPGPAIPHPRGSSFSDTPPGGHPRTCATSRASHELLLDPCKKTRFSGPGEPSHAPRPSQCRGPSDSVDMPPEAVIVHPMIAGPPIEGNLDCEIDHFISRPILI
ncbi:hypothetical protein AAG906_005333 [Vitis piasezkii]